MKKGYLFGILILIVFLFIIIKKPIAENLPSDYSTLSSKEKLDFINSNMVSGGPPKDGIPAIDKPKYIKAPDSNLKDNEIIFGINYNGFIAAYPKNMMYWHEIVNELVNGEKISLTYCPLTGSVIGYKNKNLGVSGKLYNSNLVLYDRDSNSEFPQILGTAVNGPLKGSSLEKFKVYVTTWENWKALYPDTLVLSENTGYTRDYSKSPYPGYEEVLRIWFPVAASSEVFPAKKVVHGIELNNEYLTIPKEEFKNIKQKEYVLGNEKIMIIYDNKLDMIKVYKNEVKDENLLPSFDLYWFAWYAYHPDTKILEV